MASEELTPEQVKIINEFFEGGLPSVSYGIESSFLFSRREQQEGYLLRIAQRKGLTGNDYDLYSCK